MTSANVAFIFLSVTFLPQLITAFASPGGVSQVGFSIYRDRNDYYQRRAAATAGPYSQGQNGKVLVTYSVSHPGGQGNYHSNQGADLSGSTYDLSGHFRNHQQHVQQYQTIRQGSRLPAHTVRARPTAVPVQRQTAAVTNTRQQVQYVNPYLLSRQPVVQNIYQPTAPPARRTNLIDLMSVIPTKNTPLVSRQNVPKLYIAQDDPSQALNEALDDRYPLQYF